MKGFRGLAEIVQKKNKEIKKQVKENPSSVFMLMGGLFASSSSFYWGGYLS
jgi:hypothetical protein